MSKTNDPVYDFAAIDIDRVIAILRDLALQSIRHVFANQARPELSVKNAQILAPLILPPRHRALGRRRAERFLRRPLRLSLASNAPLPLGPLEVVAATSMLRRGPAWSPSWVRLNPSGVDSGEAIMGVLARVSFEDPVLIEESATLARQRLVAEVLFGPRDRPIRFGSTALLTLIGFVLPRSNGYPRFGLVRKVEAGMFAAALRHQATAGLSDNDAWLLAEAADRCLADLPRRAGWMARVMARWHVDRRPLIDRIAVTVVATAPRYRLLAARRTDSATLAADWQGDAGTSSALRSFLTGHL